MKFSFTLRTGIIAALCLYLCISVVSAQTVTTAMSGTGKSGAGTSIGGATVSSTVKNAGTSSSKSDQPSKAAETTTKASATGTSGNNGSWRLESSWVFTAFSTILLISQMAV